LDVEVIVSFDLCFVSFHVDLVGETGVIASAGDWRHRWGGHDTNFYFRLNDGRMFGGPGTSTGIRRVDPELVLSRRVAGDERILRRLS